MIKSYRGILDDEGQDRIRLGTPQGKMGYKISKFQLMVTAPGSTTQQSVVKIYKTKQSTIDGTVDFSNDSLLGVGYQGDATGDINNALPTNAVIFDNEIFNQDLYVTHKDVDVGKACNYYIELEQVKLNENEALVAIVKNLRIEQ